MKSETASSNGAMMRYRSSSLIRRQSLHGHVCLCLVLAAQAACIGEGRLQHQTGSAGASVVEHVRAVIATSVEGRPIESLTFGDGEDCILIIATIHGDEDAGTPLLNEFVDRLGRRPDLVRGRRIVLVPLANPDGMARQIRENASGVDLNRNFPASNFQQSAQHGDGALSEPESRAIYELIHRHRPRRIVSIHQPLRCIDFDGPGDALARAMAARCDLPLKKLGGRAGSLGSYAGLTLGIPIITFEMPPEDKGLPGPELWERYGEAMIAAVTYGGPATPATPAASLAP